MLLAKDCPAVLEQVFVGFEDYGNTNQSIVYICTVSLIRERYFLSAN